MEAAEKDQPRVTPQLSLHEVTKVQVSAQAHSYLDENRPSEGNPKIIVNIKSQV